MSQPKSRKVQYLAGLCVSFAFTFTGAVISWPSPALPKFIYGETGIEITDEQSSWVVSLAALGALPGCYIGKELSERAGRRLTVLSASLPGFLGAVIILVTRSPLLMCIARVLMGIGNGITAVVTMIYLTEIADKEIRGSLGMFVQVMNNLGSLVIYSVGPFVSYTNLNLIVVSFSLCFAVICLWIPESPYYHLANGRLADAKKQFMIIKGTKDETWANEQIDVMRVHVQENMENKTTLMELAKMKYRKTIYIVSGLKVLQYMTGSLAIQSYVEMIFRRNTGISGPLVSILYGFVQLGAGIITATFLCRFFGRRILLFISTFGVAISLTLVGVYFFLLSSLEVNSEIMKSLWMLPIIGVLSFNILYAVGLGNIPYILQAELFPINVKSLASSIATMMACIFNFIVTKLYQSVKDAFGLYTVFWLFASVAYIGVFFTYFFVPETKGKTLEEVQDNIQSDEVERLNK